MRRLKAIYMLVLWAKTTNGEKNKERGGRLSQKDKLVISRCTGNHHTLKQRRMMTRITKKVICFFQRWWTATWRNALMPRSEGTEPKPLPKLAQLTSLRLQRRFCLPRVTQSRWPWRCGGWTLRPPAARWRDACCSLRGGEQQEKCGNTGRGVIWRILMSTACSEQNNAGPIWMLCAVLIRACVRTYGAAAQPDVLNDAQLNLQITGPVHTRPTLQSGGVFRCIGAF